METDNSISGFNFFIGYEFQNIFVYFLIIPLIWTIVIDWKWVKRPYFTGAYLLLFAIAVIARGGIHAFTDWSYEAGVDFCAYWKQFGYSYAEACVVWCVMYPLVFSILLAVIPARKKSSA